MTKLENDPLDWEQTLLKVHPRELLDRVERACLSLEQGQTAYTLNEDNFESRETFAAAKISSESCLTAV